MARDESYLLSADPPFPPCVERDEIRPITTPAHATRFQGCIGSPERCDSSPALPLEPFRRASVLPLNANFDLLDFVRIDVLYQIRVSIWRVVS